MSATITKKSLWRIEPDHGDDTDADGGGDECIQKALAPLLFHFRSSLLSFLVFLPKNFCNLFFLQN